MQGGRPSQNAFRAVSVLQAGQTTTAPVLAKLIRTFDIKALLLTLHAGQKPFVHDFYASTRALQFLIVDEVSRRWSVVVSDLNGAIERQTELPEGSYSGLAANEFGRIVAYRPDRGGKHSFVSLVGPSQPVQQATLSAVYAICLLPDELVTLYWDGRIGETNLTTGATVVVASGLPTLANMDSPRYLLLRPASSNRFIIVDQVAATITLRDVGADSANVVRLLAPEIQRASAEYEQERTAFLKQAQPGARLMTGIVIWGCGVAGDGNIYVGVRPFLSSEGATVLRFNQAGTLVQSLRCPLPSGESLQTTQFAPTYFGVADSLLVLADPAGFVAVYQL